AVKFSALVLVGVVGVVLVLHAFWGGSHPSADRRQPLPAGLKQGMAWAESAGRRILLGAFLTLPLFYFLLGFPLWGAGLLSQFRRPPTDAFFLGEHSSGGWWSYFPVAFLVKTPVGTLLLILASLVLFRVGSRIGRREAVFLLLPPALFFAGVALTRVNNG